MPMSNEITIEIDDLDMDRIAQRALNNPDSDAHKCPVDDCDQILWNSFHEELHIVGQHPEETR